MALDLSSLEKAVASLGRSVEVAVREIKGPVDTAHEEVIRAGVIQNFEFTYELCWKFMKRWLEVNGLGAGVDGTTRKELFRLAFENRLIVDIEAWFAYARSRNETAHTYDAARAGDVYASAVRFLKDAQALLKELKSRND